MSLLVCLPQTKGRTSRFQVKTFYHIPSFDTQSFISGFWYKYLRREYKVCLAKLKPGYLEVVSSCLISREWKDTRYFLTPLSHCYGSAFEWQFINSEIFPFCPNKHLNWLTQYFAPPPPSPSPPPSTPCPVSHQPGREGGREGGRGHNQW